MPKRLAALLVLTAALVTAPVAASAAPYVPGALCHASDYTVEPGQTVQFSSDPGCFAPNEVVEVTLTGENGAEATLAAGPVIAPLAVTTQTFTTTSDAEGAISIEVTLPVPASGSYSLSAQSESGACAVTLTVLAAGGDGLASTGLDVAPIALAGGVLALMGGLAALRIGRRRAA